jgi:hypothetical protein
MVACHASQWYSAESSSVPSISQSTARGACSVCIGAFFQVWFKTCGFRMTVQRGLAGAAATICFSGGDIAALTPLNGNVVA